MGKRDAWIVLLVWAAAWLTALALDLHDRISFLFTRYEAYEVDELYLSLLFLTGGLAWFGWRRYRELWLAKRRLEKKEKILRQSLRRHKLVAEVASDYYYSLCVAEEGGVRVEWVGGGFQRITGYSREQIGDMGQWLSAVHPEDVPALGEAMKESLAGKETLVKYRIRRPDGREIWLRDLTRPVWDRKKERVTAVHGAVSDVTEQIRTRRALEEVNRQQEMILNAAGEGIFGLDGEGRHTFVNPAAARMLGYAPQELIGRESHTLWHHTHRDGTPYPESECPIYAVLNEGALHQGNNELFWRKDGTSFEAEYVSNPLVRDGETAGAVVLFRDVTERKKLQGEKEEAFRQLKVLNRNLEQRVEEELEKRRSQETMLLQQSRLAALGDMMHQVAHHWRQPLNTVGLLTQDLLEAYDTGELDREYLARSVEHSMEKIGEMSETINRFRRFFAEEGTPRPFNVCRAVRETYALLAPGLEDAGVAYSYSCSCRTPSGEVVESGGDGPCLDSETMVVEGDPGTFAHALIALINNGKDAAVRRMAEEGGEKQGAVSIRVWNEEKTVHIAVKDNGGGVDPAYARQIFDPYFTTKAPGKGTGIGLYLAKTVMERNMGGGLTFENREGGALFLIRLPRAEAQLPK